MLSLCGLQKHPGSFLEGFTKTQVSTLAVRDNFLVAGGFQGELICKVRLSRTLENTYVQSSNQLFPQLVLMQHLDRPGVSFCSRTTYDDNAITNAIEIYNKPRYLLLFFLLYVVSFANLQLLTCPLAYVCLSAVVRFISRPQIMIVESEILIWRDISLLTISAFLGQSM